MSQIAIGTIMLFASLAILMVLRFPIAYSLGISAVITATYMNIPYLNLFQKMTTGLSSFTFIAVPFFIMMAQVMCDGQITKKLMRMCNIFVGQIRGGTAIVNILVSMLFGGISGSSAADVSSIGAMLIPAMVDEGFRRIRELWTPIFDVYDECGVKLALDCNRVWVDEQEADLTETEDKILKLLMQTPQRIFRVQVIYETVWGEPYFYVSNGTVMVHIRNLRMKVEHNPQNPQRICTVWGKGYRFAAQEDGNGNT